MSHCFSSPPPPCIFLPLVLFSDFFISSQIYMNENWDKAWNVILWKTVLFHDKLKSYFLVYILKSIIRNYKNMYIFSKYFWSPCSTDENHFDFVFLLGSFLVRYDFFFLGCVWQILYFIKTELPLNIKGNAIWNNPLQDTVLLYSIFAKYIIRIFLLIW